MRYRVALLYQLAILRALHQYRLRDGIVQLDDRIGELKAEDWGISAVLSPFLSCFVFFLSGAFCLPFALLLCWGACVCVCVMWSYTRV